MEQSIHIPLSKKKIYLLVLAAITFVAGGIWIAWYPEPFTNNTFGITQPEIIRGIGIVSILFFGFAAGYGIKKSTDKKTGLIINASGIIDHTNATSIGLIKWEDIVHIDTQQVMSTSFLLIHISNPEKYLAKASNKLQKRLMRSNMKMYSTPLSITTNTLAYNIEALEKLIRLELEKHQNS